MKKHLKTLALASLVIWSSCSDDDTSSENNGNDQAIQDMEQTPLEANDIAENVVIAGGTKNDGAPPTPNEAISLDVSSSSTTAFLGEGFEVEIESDAAIVGAYLQFKSNDGSISDSYYDIDLNSNAFDKNKRSGLHFSKKRPKSTLKKEDETTLDVDFNTNIEPGTFCYVICVYDNDGNISAPEEVCVTVEAWGGNSKALGAWEFTKEETIEDGETEILELGEENCESYLVSCSNQDRSLEITECFKVVEATLTLSENGTYTFVSNSEDDVLDYEETIAQCQEVTINDNRFVFESRGNWAYVDSENRLTLVEYSYEETDGGETFEETYEPGEGDLLFDGTAVIEGNSMIITEEEDFSGDGQIEVVYKIYFEK